jgi:hypothetical protein
VPFSTAIKNLNIAYTKSLQRYDFEAERRRTRDDNGEVDRTEEVKKFREAFMVLQGIFFTKTK